MICKEKSDFSLRISWHLYAHKCSNQFVSYIQLKLLFLSIETTVRRLQCSLNILDMLIWTYFVAHPSNSQTPGASVAG